MNVNGIEIDLIFLSLAGSHLYGTNTPNSDLDVRGVCFTPVEKLLGLEGFEQYDFNSNTSINIKTYYKEESLESSDITIYSLQKFCKLCLDSNPNIVELLFATDKSVKYAEGHWVNIYRNRHLFLSQKARHTFSGYAYSQLNRIKVYTKWRENPPEKPNPEDYGITQTDKGGYLWTNSNLKNTYDGKLKEYQNYSEWLKNRNPMRRELEKKFGYDTKHASHLMRLIIEGSELLHYGKITLPLMDKYLKIVMDIREGKWDYDYLIQEAEQGFIRLKNIYSPLPKVPNRKKVNEMLIAMELERIRNAAER